MVPETANGLECGTCHDKPGTDFSAIIAVPSVTFPSGVTRQEPGYDNVCETCHRGRESKATVDAAIAAGKPAFKNVHYLPAGAVKLGSAVHVGYEYDGKTYVGPLTHVGRRAVHLLPRPDGQPPHLPDRRRLGRHAAASATPTRTAIRRRSGSSARSTTTATATPPSRWPPRSTAWRPRTLAAMQAAAAAPGLCYADGELPLLLQGHATATRAAAPPRRCRRTGSRAWTAALAKAAFNYQLSRKEPGAWAHNFDYMAQLLYDSTADLGGDVSKLRRP